MSFQRTLNIRNKFTVSYVSRNVCSMQRHARIINRSFNRSRRDRDREKKKEKEIEKEKER